MASDRVSVSVVPSMAGRLGDFVLGLRWEDVPDSVRHECKRALLNWLGCAIGGSRHDNITTAERAHMAVAGPPQSTIIGRGRRTDMLTATLLNCTSSGVHSFDDTHAEIILHPTGPIAACSMALAETRRTSGRDFLLALLLGIEIESRLSRAIAVEPAKCHVGWYLTGVTGGIGAAAAASRMLGLPHKNLVWAMGIASGQSSGNRSMHGAMTSAMVPGHAGQCGLRATLMAEAGFTCSENFIESPNGFLSLFSEVANSDALFTGLGDKYEITANTYKPYPCGIVIHPVVDACIQLKKNSGIRGENIQRIEVSVHPTTLVLTNRRHPKNDFESVVSLHQWVAGTLTLGTCGIEVNDRRAILDPVIAGLRDRIDVVVDTSLASDAARVVVTDDKSNRFNAAVEHCKGSATRPMSDNDLEAKFTDLCEGVIERKRADKLIAMCWDVDRSDDVADIARQAA